MMINDGAVIICFAVLHGQVAHAVLRGHAPLSAHRGLWLQVKVSIDVDFAPSLVSEREDKPTNVYKLMDES